jgi:hypothetical protein
VSLSVGVLSVFMVKDIRKTSSVTYSNLIVWHIIIGTSGEFSVVFSMKERRNEGLISGSGKIVRRWIINVLPVRNICIFFLPDNIFIRDGSEKL